MRPKCIHHFKAVFLQKTPIQEVCNYIFEDITISSVKKFKEELSRKKMLIVLFFHPDVASCIVLKDALSIISVKARAKRQEKGIYFCDVTNKEVNEIIQKYVLLKESK